MLDLGFSMGEDKAGGGPTPCDHCSDAAAVLYCLADAARLCVACDRHVHQANALSKKHFRSQICDNCGKAAASSRCIWHGLALCSDCDSEVHSAVDGHRRVAVEGFSSCPSAIELATSWGLELNLKDCSGIGDQTVFDGLATLDSDFADLYVPCVLGGGRKSALVRQLEELARKECKSGDAEGSRLSPKTPCQSSNGFSSSSEADRQTAQQFPFTSLLLDQKSDCVDFKEDDRIVQEGDLMWEYGPSEHASQVLCCSHFLFMILRSRSMSHCFACKSLLKSVIYEFETRIRSC